MTTNSRSLLFASVIIAAFIIPSQKAVAKDDFGKIVHHIEVQYHVHRQHRWVMGLAGLTVKFWHVAGVKSLKGAIFENQPFVNAASDIRFDEIVRAAMDSGWQPLVQSWDRHSGQRTYIYAQNLGRDVKLLIVNLESDEAVVLQVKVDPNKLNRFIEETMPEKRHHGTPSPQEEAPARTDDTVALAQASAQSWDGICLISQDEPPALNEP